MEDLEELLNDEKYESCKLIHDNFK